MHGLPDQAEFEHGAVILDESAGLEQKGVRVRGLPFDAPAHALARRAGRKPLDQRLQRNLAVTIVETDIEACARLAGNEIDDRIADIDGGKLQIGRAEMRAALVERGG